MTTKMGAPLGFSESDNIVAQARRKLGISQKEFARLIGLTPGAVSQFENGRRQLSGPVSLLCGIILAHPEVIPTLQSERRSASCSMTDKR